MCQKGRRRPRIGKNLGVSTSTDWDYPSSGGAGDNGAYLRMTSVDTPGSIGCLY